MQIKGKSIHMDSAPCGEDGKRVYQFRTEGTIFGNADDMMKIVGFIEKTLKDQNEFHPICDVGGCESARCGNDGN